MVSELIKESLKMSFGKVVLIFLQNGFRFEGKVLGCDNDFIKLFDFKRNTEKFIRLSEVAEAELR